MTGQDLIGTPGRIYDRGHRRYVGRRSGLRGATRSLVIHSVRSVLGLGRPGRMKVVPVAVILFSYLPAIAFVGVAALLPVDLREEGLLPTYAGYYGYVIAAIYLFAAFIAPLLLTHDRRTGMLGVYLSSPLNRTTYLAGKAIAALGLILLVTLGPPLLMLIAFTLEESGPGSVLDWLDAFVRIVASSLVLGLLFVAIGLAVAAATDRPVVATAAIALIFPGSAIVSDRFVYDAHLSPALHLINLANLPRELIFRIHGETGRRGVLGAGNLWSPDDVSTPALSLVWLAVVLGCLTYVWSRYRKLLVRR